MASDKAAMARLVAELRDCVANYDCIGEAADELEWLDSRLSSQEAEIERLSVALKPFADDAERLRNYPDDYPYGFPITPITVGDFRRARAALTPLPEGGNG